MNATGIEAEVCRDIAERQKLGKNKYGQELADNNAYLSERLQHAYEESLDKCVYLKWAIKQAIELEDKLVNASEWIENSRTR